jgi:hypothetical protein
MAASSSLTLGLVAARLIFWCIFEAFQCLTQAARIDTSAGADTKPDKRPWAPLMRRMLFDWEFILYSHDSSIHRKPSPVDPSKKIIQPAPSSYATPVAPSAGVTDSTTLSVAEA